MRIHPKKKKTSTKKQKRKKKGWSCFCFCCWCDGEGLKERRHRIHYAVDWFCVPDGEGACV